MEAFQYTHTHANMHKNDWLFPTTRISLWRNQSGFYWSVWTGCAEWRLALCFHIHYMSRFLCLSQFLFFSPHLCQLFFSFSPLIPIIIFLPFFFLSLSLPSFSLATLCWSLYPLSLFLSLYTYIYSISIQPSIHPSISLSLSPMKLALPRLVMDSP